MRISFAAAALLILSAAGFGPAFAGLTPAQACLSEASAGSSSPEATSHCNEALRDAEDGTARAQILLGRGIIYLHRGDAERALRDLNAAVAGEPGLAAAHFNRGSALVMLRDYGEAIPALERAIALNTAEPAKAYYLRGAAYEGLGQTRAAYDDYRRAAELAPDWGQPQQELARFQARPN